MGARVAFFEITSHDPDRAETLGGTALTGPTDLPDGNAIGLWT